MAFDMKRNTLDESMSPYLKQHSGNPVNWQEWSPEALSFARESKRPVLVSVGYSTCHWCHVMAREAFSDRDVAVFLNENFVPIKVDREERPDIDSRMMAACQAMTGSGGWPLNVFLNSELKPFFAMTYGPLTPKYGMPGFMDILRQLKRHHDSGKEAFDWKVFPMPVGRVILDDHVANAFRSIYDREYAGFGSRQKFPPHSSLLFMLYYSGIADKNMLDMAENTLDAMLFSGLYDHLRGGFFRYSVDREWRIPHFEKMLYDQAMHIWTYSLGFMMFKNSDYKRAVRETLECLDRTFQPESGLYCSALDADTAGREGLTYLWDRSELERLLEPGEFRMLEESFDISRHGNFEGKVHLIMKPKGSIQDALKSKLLDIRNTRQQPLLDHKRIASWNCLLGTGLVNAYRYLGESNYLDRANGILNGVLENHYADGRMKHACLDGRTTGEELLEDYSAFLLLVSYLQEDTEEHTELMGELARKIESFRGPEGWIESRDPSLGDIPAGRFDHPTPSSISMAELGLKRASVLSGDEYLADVDFLDVHGHDFYNISAMISKGRFHVITSDEEIAWHELEPNSIQKRGPENTDCFMGACRKTKRG